MKWILPKNINTNQLELYKDVTPFFAELLLRRGIGPDEVDGFLHPLNERYGNPYLLPNMNIAVERIVRSYQTDEHVAIWGDYDADGLTSQAILSNAFQEWGFKHVSLYTPHRSFEGYGLNKKGIEILAREGITLIIALDLGTANKEEVAYASTLGIDTVIFDHHEIKEEEVAEALALVNPHLPHTYPYAHFAACGLTYMLVRALSTQLGIPSVQLNERLRSLVAIGTVADIVPMTGENRMLVTTGLRSLQESEDAGLNALIRISRHDKRYLQPTDISFGLAPRINAVGRLYNAEIVRNVLHNKSKENAFLGSLIMEKSNRQRQAMTKEIMENAIAQVEALDTLPRIIFVSDESWKTGVVGLIAGRIAEKYHRPCLAYGCHNGVCSGSARSIGGIDIVALLSKAGMHFIRYGGHKQAAGFSFYGGQSPFIQEIMEKEAQHYPEEMFEPKLYIDMDIDPSALTWQTIEDIHQLAPFGIGNREPLFRIRDVSIDDAKTMGGDNTHLKFNIVREDEFLLSAVAFSQANRKWTILPRHKYDICGTIGINRWNGSQSLQIQVQDFRPADFIE